MARKGLKLGFKLENDFKPRHSDVKLYKNYAVQGLCSVFNQLCAAWFACGWLGYGLKCKLLFDVFELTMNCMQLT